MLKVHLGQLERNLMISDASRTIIVPARFVKSYRDYRETMGIPVNTAGFWIVDPENFTGVDYVLSFVAQMPDPEMAYAQRDCTLAEAAMFEVVIGRHEDKLRPETKDLLFGDGALYYVGRVVHLTHVLDLLRVVPGLESLDFSNRVKGAEEASALVLPPPENPAPRETPTYPPVTDDDRLDIWWQHTFYHEEHATLCNQYPQYSSAQINGAKRTGERKIWDLRVAGFADSILDDLYACDQMYKDALDIMEELPDDVLEDLYRSEVEGRYRDMVECRLLLSLMDDVAPDYIDPYHEDAQWLLEEALDVVNARLHDQHAGLTVGYDNAGGMYGAHSRWGCYVAVTWDTDQALADLAARKGV